MENSTAKFLQPTQLIERETTWEFYLSSETEGTKTEDLGSGWTCFRVCERRLAASHPRTFGCPRWEVEEIARQNVWYLVTIDRFEISRKRLFCVAENLLYLLSFTNDERNERTGCEERDFVEWEGRRGQRGDCSPVPSETAENIRLSVFT